MVEGFYKLESIEAALKVGYLNVLITDDRTAQALIDTYVEERNFRLHRD
ncbi:sugar-binding domain-containing protein [Virgibacillus kekensis]|uniref:Sugar-binding domain-containing protein n=1 Tax=Virgibacillus kekensis TaxID=202261 RepID=A0ABV9DI67_9BACI